MTSTVENLTTDSFNDFISKGNVIVDFYADWCGPCKQMAPDFDKAASNTSDAKFAKLNVDGNQDVAGQYQVMSIPTIIFFKDGEQVDRHTGPLNESEIKERAAKAFS